MKKTKSFTMAEILLSLTIIGVVAAITLPSLTGNINERTWNTQRKALYARMSQAIALMGSINGYGQYAGSWSANSVNVTTDTAAEAFVTEGLAKVLKINNICDNQHFQDCGLPEKYIKFLDSEKVDFPKTLAQLNSNFTMDRNSFSNVQKNVNTKAVAFETQNGESVAVFYNPQCVSEYVIFPQQGSNAALDAINILPYMCAVFIYDLNGQKGPNTMGEDMWYITAMYSSNTAVVTFDPKKLTKGANTSYNQAIAHCASLDGRLPTVKEGISAHYAQITSVGWLSGAANNDTSAYVVAYGSRFKYPKHFTNIAAHCIKR